MMNFFKRATPLGDFSSIALDVHSHLLPGLDDGAKDFPMAVEMVAGLKELGFRKLVTTPHIYKEYYPNTRDEILRQGEALNKALVAAGVDLEVQPCAEYYLDEHFDELLEKDELLSFGGDKKYVLVEASFFGPPARLEEQIFRMRTKGYTPVLAHPERYMVWMSKRWQLQRLKDLGCLLQLNLLSLVGYYGKEIKKQARSFVKQGLIDFYGTDAHDPRHVEMLKEWVKSAESSILAQVHGVRAKG